MRYFEVPAAAGPPIFTLRVCRRSRGCDLSKQERPMLKCAYDRARPPSAQCSEALCNLLVEEESHEGH